MTIPRSYAPASPRRTPQAWGNPERAKMLRVRDPVGYCSRGPLLRWYRLGAGVSARCRCKGGTYLQVACRAASRYNGSHAMTRECRSPEAQKERVTWMPLLIVSPCQY